MHQRSVVASASQNGTFIHYESRKDRPIASLSLPYVQLSIWKYHHQTLGGEADVDQTRYSYVPASANSIQGQSCIRTRSTIRTTRSTRQDVHF